MEAVKISLKEYFLFYKSVYKNDNNFKDNKSGIIKLVCSKDRAFFKNSKQEIIAVKDNQKLLCATVLIIHKNAPAMLSLAFFEALQDCHEAVNILIEYAVEFGRLNGCKQMVAGLDGHINNSFAFPLSSSQPSFGENYCPQYYHSYFQAFEKIKIVGFCGTIDLLKSYVANDLSKIDRFKNKITLEYANFGCGFRETIRRYTNLNNEIFATHRYYFHRNYDEDYELFYDMRPLLKNENLIFAKYNNKDIGFILWYPNFNELVPTLSGASIFTFIKYKLLKKNPKTVKCVEIGVNAKYRLFGTILFLFNAATNKTSKCTEKIISSWILDENIKSKAITQRYIGKPYKDYFVYEKEL